MSLLLVVLAILAGSLIVGGTVVYFLRARYREAVETSGARPIASGPAPAPDEVRAIGDQIERSMAEQRVQGETQRQMLAQKLDEVRQTVEAQRTYVDGIRNELRHETQRRDAELAELRSQIGSIQQTVQIQAAAPAALPPAAPSSGLASEPIGAPPATPPEAAPLEAAPPPAPAPPDEPSFVDVAFDAAPEAPGSFHDVTFEEATFQDATFQEATFEDATFGEVDVPAASSGDTSGASFEEIAFDVSPGAPVEDDPPFAPPGETTDDIFSAWTPSPPSAPSPAPVSNTFTDVFASPAPPPSAPRASTATASAEAAPLADLMPEAETAWIARPDRSDAPEPTVSPAGLLDLDALAGAPPRPSNLAPPPSPAPQAESMLTNPPSVPEAVPSEPEAATVEPESAEDAPAPFVAPEGAEDLTVISSIDEHTQRLLYLAGVTTLEEIAQWGRTDARRVGNEVEVSEDTIMNVWVFEAQSALFSRYANGG